MKEKLIEILKKLNLYSEEKHGEIEKAIADLKLEESKPSSAKQDISPEVHELITALQGQVKALSDALAEETKLRKQQADAVAAQIKKDREAKIEAALKKAKDEGKITPAQEAHYKKLLESDYDTTTAVLEALPVNPATKKEQQKPEEGKPTIPASATLANAGLQSIREQIAKLTTISDN